MPREGAIIFRDLIGKLEVLRVECDKCGRKGQYRVDQLIEQYGIDAKLFDWEPAAHCPPQAGEEFERHLRRPVSGFIESGLAIGSY
jgi:hypothetical protein